jgi:hypothetical protein
MAEKWMVSELIYRNFHVTDMLHDVPNIKNFSHPLFNNQPLRQ